MPLSSASFADAKGAFAGTVVAAAVVAPALLLTGVLRFGRAGQLKRCSGESAGGHHNKRVYTCALTKALLAKASLALILFWRLVHAPTVPTVPADSRPSQPK
jgi:hypothetical protein